MEVVLKVWLVAIRRAPQILSVKNVIGKEIGSILVRGATELKIMQQIDLTHKERIEENRIGLKLHNERKEKITCAVVNRQRCAPPHNEGSVL